MPGKLKDGHKAMESHKGCSREHRIVFSRKILPLIVAEEKPLGINKLPKGRGAVRNESLFFVEHKKRGSNLPSIPGNR